MRLDFDISTFIQFIVNEPCSDAYNLASRPRVMLISKKQMKSTAYQTALTTKSRLLASSMWFHWAQKLWDIRSEERKKENKLIAAIHFPYNSKDAETHVANSWIIITRIFNETTTKKTFKGCLGGKYLIQIRVIFSSRKNDTVSTLSASTWWFLPLKNAPSTC